MNLENLSRLPVECVYSQCSSHQVSLELRAFVRKSSYYRKSDGKWVPRFFCKTCNHSFSQARNSPCFGQKKRKLNSKIEKLLVSGVSQRRIARLLGISRNTVVSKFLFLATQAKQEHREFQKRLEQKKLSRIFFDEMESVERSKCLPVSIPLAVDPSTRKIVAFQVCSMPAKGPLAQLSRKRYGLRVDERPQAAAALWAELKSALTPTAEISTDQKAAYPSWIKPYFPEAIHKTYKGRRGCVVGQGELKRGGFDPLFALNHTAAMLRANINRLFRRTWCITKKKARLEAHIYIYARHHNQVLTEALP
jgi:transposase-like protein